MLNFLLGLIFLILQSIEDIKTYEIDEKLCYFFGFLGIIYHVIFFLITKNLNFLIFPIVSFVITFLFLYSLWRIGFIGGGDLKVITTISLIVPSFNYSQLSIFNLFPLILFIFSILCTLPFAIIYTLSKRTVIFWIKRILELKRELKLITCILILLSLEYLFKLDNLLLRMILIIFLYRVVSENIVLTVIFLILDLMLNFKETIVTLVIIIAILIVILYLKTFRKVLSREISLEESEGEILSNDYFLIDGKVTEIDPFKRFLINGKPIVLSKASGITKEDIEKLKKYGISKVKIKEKIPFIPSILLAYIILYIVKGIW